MIRLIFVALFLLLFLVGGLPILLVEWIIGKFNMELKNRSSLRIVQGAFKIILFLCGTKLVIRGEENVPLDEPVLYVGNHRSYFDTVITYSRVPRQTGYVSKKEMEKWPILRIWMKYLHCLFLDRKDVKQGLQTILQAIELAKNGVSICIFPEGTRNKVNDTFLEFHEGSFKVASKSGCLVQPMAIYGSANILEDHMPKIKKTTVIVEYMKPFYIKDLPKEDQKKVGAYTREMIIEKYAELKELAGTL